MTPWAQLEREAGKAGRQLVLVYGSGANAHVLRQVDPQAPLLGWSQLLESATEETFGKRRPGEMPRAAGTNTLWWDHLAAHAAVAHGGAFAGERALQGNVAQLLETLYRGWAERSRHAWESLLGRCEDAVSFNFDSLVVRSVREVWLKRKRRARWASPVALAGQMADTRVWYPHGHVSRPSSIMLGTHLYGTAIEDLRQAFGEYKRRERTGEGPVKPRTWLDVFVSPRPLVFVGLSLTREEWTLWWALVRRARNFARVAPELRPGTYIVQVKPAFDAPADRQQWWETLEASAALVGATVCQADDYVSGWQHLAVALARA
jgi:hypothetical protein